MSEHLDFRPRNAPCGDGQTVPAAPYEGLADWQDDTPEARNYCRLLERALDQAAQTRRELVEAHRRIAFLQHQARTDDVTGLLNRRGFDLAFEASLSRARRFGGEGVLVVIDLDCFEGMHDAYGHEAKDLVRASVGALLSRQTRLTDSVARIGGDRFAAILTETDLKGAKKRVRVLDRMLNYTTIPWKGAEIPVKASFGAVAYGPADDKTEVFERANAAMYAHKGMPIRVCP